MLCEWNVPHFNVERYDSFWWHNTGTNRSKKQNFLITLQLFDLFLYAFCSLLAHRSAANYERLYETISKIISYAWLECNQLEQLNVEHFRYSFIYLFYCSEKWGYLLQHELMYGWHMKTFSWKSTCGTNELFKSFSFIGIF